MNWALPKEILWIVSSKLDCHSLFNAIYVNKYWNEYFDDQKIWKDIAFRGDFVHYYRIDDLNVNWREVVLNFAETRKNLLAGRFSLETIAAQAPDGETDILPSSCTVHDKYCLINWISRPPASFDQFFGCELWDLESKQKIQSYAKQLQFLADQVANIGWDLNDSSESRYILRAAPFEVASPNPLESKSDFKISIEHTGTTNFFASLDESALVIAETKVNWEDSMKTIVIYDLKTGRAVLEFVEEYLHNSVCICGNNLLIGDENKQNNGMARLIDIKSRAVINVPHRQLSTMTHDEIISVEESYLYRYNLHTKVEKKILLDTSQLRQQFAPEPTKIQCVNGVIALTIHHQFWFFDPNDGTALNCIQLEGRGRVSLFAAANGKLVLENEIHGVKILSLKDKDVGVPIEILEVTNTGDTKVHKIIQGKMYDLFSKLDPYTSTLVHETANERYSLIHVPAPDDNNLYNRHTSKVLEHRNVISPNHHAVTVQRIKDNAALPTDYLPYTRLTMRAYGAAFVMYEKMIDCKWCFAVPSDKWHFIVEQMK